MDALLITLFILAALVLFFHWIVEKRKAKFAAPLPAGYKDILLSYVEFYRHLDEPNRIVFEERMQQFLSHVRITGVKTTVEDTDRILIAASAIIPIFGFPNWEYINLNEVLLYPDAFNHEFRSEGPERNTLGMVGDGPYQNVMLLSQHELRQGFINKTGKQNTAIHEFTHLVDKSDGSVDGVPELFLDRRYILPWIEQMHREIAKIMKDRSDINPYGATNEAEFFAVVSEYFFERPDLLEEKHPELYGLLSKMFRQEPKVN